MPDKNIQIYITKKNELAFKFESNTECVAFMNLDLVAAGKHYASNQDMLFVACTPDPKKNTFKMKFNSTGQRARFQLFLTKLGIQKDILTDDSDEYSLEIPASFFSEGDAEKKHKSVTLTEGLYTELLTAAQEQQTAALSDLHTNFNQHIKFIADRTYLRKMPDVPNPEFQKATNVTGMEFTELLTKKTVDSPDRKQLIRGNHGLRHATRVTNYIDILHKFRSEQTLTNEGKLDTSSKDNIEGVAKFFSITTEDVLMLTKFAAFFHDSAREGEQHDFWDHRSAENCYNFLVNKGINEKAARFFANAARFKGHGKEFNIYLKTLGIPEDQQEALYNNFHYVRNLINAADTLDIMRCKDTFEAYRLDDFFQVKENEQNKEQSRQLMRNIHGVIVAEGDGREIKCIFNSTPPAKPDDIETLKADAGAQWTFADKLHVEHHADPYSVMKQHIDSCMSKEIPAPNNVVAVNPGTPQQQNLATSMANLEEQFKTELQVAKAQKQAPKDPKHLSNKQSLGSEPLTSANLNSA